MEIVIIDIQQKKNIQMKNIIKIFSIPRIAYINGNDALSSLRDTNILNKCVSITNCRFRNIVWEQDMPIFKETNTLFIKKCDQDFPNYRITKKIFPVVKTIYYLDEPYRFDFMKPVFCDIEIYILKHYPPSFQIIHQMLLKSMKGQLNIF
jgi:hypothetical protein